MTSPDWEGFWMKYTALQQRDRESAALERRIVALESALLEAMEWNWLDDDAPDRSKFMAALTKGGVATSPSP